MFQYFWIGGKFAHVSTNQVRLLFKCLIIVSTKKVQFPCFSISGLEASLHMFPLIK